MQIPFYSSAEESPDPPSPPPELPPELPLETPPPVPAGAPLLGDPPDAGAAVGVVVITITLGTVCVVPVTIFLPDFASSFILFPMFFKALNLAFNLIKNS